MWVPRRAKIAAIIGGVALAAGVACQVGRRAPLPRYELRIEGGRAAYLGSQGAQRLDAESRLSITLRPELAVKHRVFVSAMVEEQSRERAWPVLFERTPQGALRLQGPLHELRLPCSRRCTLTLYVSDFPLFPALLWLVPQAHRSRLLPRTQVLRSTVLIELPILGPGQ